MSDQEIFHLFFHPQSIALIGVSTRTGPASFNIMELIINSGYPARLYPVNPRGGEILGQRVYTSVLELPDIPDLAVISTPRTAVPHVLAQCAQKGIKAAVIITQGFSDADDQAGHDMHRQIVDIVRNTGIRVIGPNTLGVVNNYDHFRTSFVNFQAGCQDVGIICQSGIFLAASEDFSRGVGLGADIGNTADVDFADLLQYLTNHEQIKVINLHMEGLKNGRHFLDTARQATSKKPVIVFKTGRSEQGARAAASHSGSMTGEDIVFSAAFNQCGIIRVDNASLMGDLNKTFLTYKSIPGQRAAIVTVSGGAGIAAVDACSKYGLEVATFSPDTMQKLQALYPDWMRPGNPADIWPAGMSRGYWDVTRQALDVILSDPAVDMLLMITPAYLHPDQDPMNISSIFKEVAACYPEKPLAVWIFGPYRDDYRRVIEEAGSVVAYDCPEKAAFCLKQLYCYHHKVKGKVFTRPVPPDGLDKAMVRQILTNTRQKVLNEEALEILSAYQIPVVGHALAENAAKACRLADELGYPLVLKIASPDITHKSDVGGVILNIKDQHELVAAYDRLMQNMQKQHPAARINGVLLQPFVSGGQEVIMGGKTDPQFGPVVIFGLGGIFTEAIRDIACRVAPISPEDAMEMIREIKSYSILSGLRGHKSADIEALAECLHRLSFLLYHNPEIMEVDLNPVLAGPKGCLALDARIVLE